MLISSGQRIIDRWRNPSNQTSEEQKTPIFFAQQGIIRIKADQGVTSIGRRRRGRVKGSSHVQASSRSVHFSDHYAWWLQSVLLSHEILLLTQRWVSVPPPPRSELVKEGRTSWVSTVRHWSSLVRQGHRVVSSLTAQPCWLQWLGAVTLLLLPFCKATTGLGRLSCLSTIYLVAQPCGNSFGPTAQVLKRETEGQESQETT